MDNPEEVLQALDEFQKVRPSEIPRELEDYLYWVARTGDPVYQWSLVKALFREKLVRVMTEFYDNCPTLDLTPCPNVEQFNYDIMKNNLLERLESFANAPFTVQRISELLTTPRKEYSRIDKFMRAIEKNILVVSTREPGLYGRRSENGDGLVNGSVEDETSHQIEHQLSVLNTSFVSTSDDDDDETTTVVQNLTTTNHEAIGLVGDVSDVIMNEDTSSQPSLELETNDNDSDSKKLQTTFQAKDFTLDEEKSPKSYADVLKDDKPEKNLETVEPSKEYDQSENLSEKLLREDTSNLENSDLSDNLDANSILSEPEQVEKKVEAESEPNKNDDSESEICVGDSEISNDTETETNKIEEAVDDLSKTEPEEECNINVQDDKIDIIKEITSEVTAEDENSTSHSFDETKSEEASEECKPIVEELPINSTETAEENKIDSTELTIEETLVDDVKPNKTIVPDPIPIIEEPKEEESVIQNWDTSVSVTDVTNEPKDDASAANDGLAESPVTSNQVQDNQTVMTDCEEATSKKSESMDIDSESLTASTQQDEPMEQETTEAISS